MKRLFLVVLMIFLIQTVNAEICKDTTNWWTGYSSYNMVESDIGYSNDATDDYLTYMTFKYKGQPINSITLYSNKTYIFKAVYTGLTLYNFSGTATIKDVNGNILGNASYEVRRNYKYLTETWDGFVGVYFYDSDINWNQLVYNQELRVYFNAPQVEGHSFSKFVPDVKQGGAFTVEDNTLDPYDIGFFVRAQWDVWRAEVIEIFKYNAYGLYQKLRLMVTKAELSEEVYYQLTYRYTKVGELYKFEAWNFSESTYNFVITDYSNNIYESVNSPEPFEFYTFNAIKSIELRNPDTNELIYTFQFDYCGVQGEQENNVTISFYFIDVTDNSIINDVTLNLSVDYNLDLTTDYTFSGTVDSGYSISVINPSGITYEVSKDGYTPEYELYGASPFINADSDTWVTISMIPENVTPSEPDKVPILFYVIDEQANEVADAFISVSGVGSVSTNQYGTAIVEVDPNSTYDYTVSKDGYYSVHDSVSVGTEQETVTVTLIHVIPTPTPTPSPTPTASPTPTQSPNGGGGGWGSYDTTGLDRGINLIYQNAEGLIGLGLLASIFGFLKLMRWRR